MLQIQNVARFYYKCLDCLSAFAVTEKYSPRAMRCACGGEKIEFMGQVRQDQLVRIEERCACDERCTSAQGPRCDCKCGGMNHGTGRIVKIEVRQNIPTALVDAESVARGEAFRQARREAEYALCAKHGDAWVNIVNGRFHSNREQYFEASRAHRKLYNASKLKVHTLRMRRLAELSA